MAFTLDYTGVKTEVLPKGTYPCVVTGSEVVATQAGEPRLKLKFLITDGEWEGTSFGGSLMLTAKAAGFHNRFRAALGFEPLTGQVEFEEEDYIGQELRVVTDISTYNPANPFPQAASYLPLEDSAPWDNNS